jgi:hypothetical protein
MIIWFGAQMDPVDRQYLLLILELFRVGTGRSSDPESHTHLKQLNHYRHIGWLSAVYMSAHIYAVI